MVENPIALELIRQTAETVVKEYVKLPEELTNRKGREGGYMTIKNAQNAKIEAIYLIGDVPVESSNLCIINSEEKANRLYDMIFVKNLNHLTSFESRDPNNAKYGGAIYFPRFRLEKYILSISGLPELGDEVCMLCTKAFVSSRSKTMVTAIASSMMHSVYFKEVGRPGQEQFRALLGAFDIKV